MKQKLKQKCKSHDICHRGGKGGKGKSLTNSWEQMSAPLRPSGGGEQMSGEGISPKTNVLHSPNYTDSVLKFGRMNLWPDLRPDNKFRSSLFVGNPEE